MDFHYTKLALLSLAFAASASYAQTGSTEPSADYSAIVATAGQSYAFSLEDCITFAFGNSLTRQSMKLNEKSAELQLEQSKNARKPSVSASAGESLSHTGHDDGVNLGGNLGISAGATLYQGRAIVNGIERSRLEAERSVMQTEQYDHNLIIQILQYFLTALSNEEMLKYQQQIVETSEEQLRQGEQKYKVGTILESDYMILQAQYEANKCNLLNSEISRDNALLNLKQALSMDPTAELQLIYPDTTDLEKLSILPTIDQCVQRTLDTNPDVKLAQYSIDIANVAKEITKAGRRPTLSASAGLSTRHSNFSDFGHQLGNNFSQSIGLNLSVPIYDRGQTKTALKMRDIEIKNAEIDKQNTELKLRQTVTEECHNVKISYAQCKAYEKKAEAYKNVYDAYTVQFQYGAITSVDLLQQQNNYINSLTDYINSKYSFILRRKILDVYMDYPIKYEAVKE